MDGPNMVDRREICDEINALLTRKFGETCGYFLVAIPPYEAEGDIAVSRFSNIPPDLCKQLLMLLLGDWQAEGFKQQKAH